MDDFEDLLDEASFEYTVTNGRKTHLLKIDLPSPSDEETYLLVLRNYLLAQSENLRRIYGDKKNH